MRPIALGLLDDDPDTREKAYEYLKKAVLDYDFRVSTGFLSTVFLLPTLVESGDTEAAYKVLENTKSPGWLYEISKGATTIWEDWEGTVSRNHYSPGAVCQWFFDGICGIKVSGENEFTVEPVPGGSLKEASASYDSIYGKIESSWKKTDSGYTYSITVPANCTAAVKLPGKGPMVLEAGTYTF